MIFPNKLLVATRNEGKVEELQDLLVEVQLEIMTLKDYPHLPEIEEDGITFLDNAKIKAAAAAKATGLLTLADDSGLEVDALSGRPGVFSARFAGEPSDDIRNNLKLLKCLEKVPMSQRAARFVSVIVIATPQGQFYETEGQCEGIILDKMKGSGGFGYDPLFYIPFLDKTFAELTTEEKNKISHRGKALRKAAVIINRLFQE